MSIPSLFTAFSAFLHSPQFRDLACHADAGNAFVRTRKLPLPALVAIVLSGIRKRVQTELDEFFAHLREPVPPVRHVSEQAFAKARAKLAATAIPTLNDWLIARADADEFVARWRGLRLVAAGTSTLCFGCRASHVPRAASADQIAFGLYVPGAKMTLAASLQSVHESARQMPLQHLDRLTSGDILLMDPGYPSRWLVAVLNARGVGFRMRVEKAGNTGFACVRDFLRSDADDRIVTLAAPDRRDAEDYECPAFPQTARLIPQVASTGKVHVLMTNLLDQAAFPCSEFGDLYRQRWRIEETFKRLKHRLNLEHVSGLSQQSALHDFAAKILCAPPRPWPRKPRCAPRHYRRRGASTAPPPTPS